MSYSVDVIICIHNALDDVKNCIESVLRTNFTGGTYKLILVDDGSDEPTADYVKSIAADHDNISSIRRENAGGYTIAANTGLRVDDMDAAVERAAKAIPVMPRVPLLNGFCYMIRHSILEGVGLMDEDGFPRGFGEEDDFCMRTAVAGFGIMIALNTYVYHAKSKSYGAKTRNSLSQKGQIMLKKKHGEIRLARAVASMRHNPPRVKLDFICLWTDGLKRRLERLRARFQKR